MKFRIKILYVCDQNNIVMEDQNNKGSGSKDMYGVTRTSTPEHVHGGIGVCASVGNQTHVLDGGDSPGGAAKGVSGTADGAAEKRLGFIKLLRQAMQTNKKQRKGGGGDKRIGNTKGIRLTIGTNIVERRCKGTKGSVSGGRNGGIVGR